MNIHPRPHVTPNICTTAPSTAHTYGHMEGFIGPAAGGKRPVLSLQMGKLVSVDRKWMVAAFSHILGMVLKDSKMEKSS